MLGKEGEGWADRDDPKWRFAATRWALQKAYSMTSSATVEQTGAGASQCYPVMAPRHFPLPCSRPMYLIYSAYWERARFH